MADSKDSPAGTKEKQAALNATILEFLDRKVEQMIHLCNDDGNGNNGTTLATAALIEARAFHIAVMKDFV